jgi:hypothetical protein
LNLANWIDYWSLRFFDSKITVLSVPREKNFNILKRLIEVVNLLRLSVNARRPL